LTKYLPDYTDMIYQDILYMAQVIVYLNRLVLSIIHTNQTTTCLLTWIRHDKFICRQHLCGSKWI